MIEVITFPVEQIPVTSSKLNVVQFSWFLIQVTEQSMRVLKVKIKSQVALSLAMSSFFNFKILDRNFDYSKCTTLQCMFNLVINNKQSWHGLASLKNTCVKGVSKQPFKVVK